MPLRTLSVSMATMGSQGEWGPRSARNAAEFVALLRELKERSGLTYRQLEERAAERGDVLARSTLADALRQDALPRIETLMAFLRACGEERHVDEWLAVRDNLAAGRTDVRTEIAEPDSDEPKSPPAYEPERREQPPEGRRGIPRGRLVGAMLALLVVGAASLAVAMTNDDGEPETRGTGPTASAAPSAPPTSTPRPRPRQAPTASGRSSPRCASPSWRARAGAISSRRTAVAAFRCTPFRSRRMPPYGSGPSIPSWATGVSAWARAAPKEARR
ncbi:hypothetical protein Strvi_8099 [Streptomyces violaceusniger Tu 4113]|uniref:Uncharacterized protein n=1 Tax=Streptomyces violaceusniger (strain Tu 4113) TaxID=653045 RepID=G2P8W8_STRV4|nr:hypothetical protein Strvi_8099 [Streptomyces violaceusniger Tu 4113]